MDIGRDDHAAARDFIADEVGGDPLAPGDVFHLLCNSAQAGVMHLCTDAVAGAPRYPFVSHTESIILT